MKARRVRRSPLRNRVALVLLLAFSQFPLGASGVPAGKQGAVQLSDEEANDLIARIKDLVVEAETLLKSHSSTRLDPEDALEAADYEADAIFEWVNSKTRWVPYRGILRGPSGVLIDRRGNSLDRSLLLANMLADAGYEARLARVRLSPEEAERLIENHVVTQDSRSDTDGGLADFEPVRGYQQEVRAQARDLAQLTGISEDTGSGAFSDQHLADVADHWWVQLRHENGWRNLDLMSWNSSESGTPAGASIHALDSLPAELFHKLTVELVIERWEDKHTVEASALAHEMKVAELPLFSQFEIRFDPFATAWTTWNESSPALQPLDVANGATHWRPSLEINGRTIAGDWFNAAGSFETPALFSAALKMDDATAALNELGTDPQTGKPPASQLTAAWLEFRTSDPSGTTETVRRELFDFLGARRNSGDIRQAPEMTAADRQDRGLALQTQVSNLVVTSMPHPDALDRSFLETWVENRNGFIALVYLAAGWEDDRVPLALTQGEIRYPTYDLLKIAAIRGNWSVEKDDVYIDRPNVLSAHLTKIRRGDETSLEFQMDIVLHHVGVAPGASRHPRLVRLEQGVLDTLAETVVTGSEDSLNTFRHFARRTNAGEDWITVKPGLADLERLSILPDGDRARMAAAMRAGSAAVASPVTYAVGDHRFASWWRVDLADGTTLGHGYRGWGTEVTEYKSSSLKNTALKEGSEEVGQSYYCRAFYAVVDVTQQLNTKSPEFRALLIQDGAPLSRMEIIKKQWSAFKGKIMKLLGMGKNLC